MCDAERVQLAIKLFTPTITIVGRKYTTRTPPTATDIREMIASRRLKGPGFLWDDVRAPDGFTERELLLAAAAIETQTFDNFL